MKNRRIPGTELDPSEIGLSVAECLPSRVLPPDEALLVRLVQAAFDRGVSCFDVSDPEGTGLGETVVSRALGAHRREVMLITSGGASPTAHRRELFEKVSEATRSGHLIAPGPDRPARDFRPDSLRRSCEESLRRLGTDAIDLYLLDRPPVSLLERDFVWQTLERLRNEGKIREFGVTIHAAPDEADAISCASEAKGNRAIGVVHGLLRQEPVRSAIQKRRKGGTTEAADESAALLVRKPTAWGLLGGPASSQPGSRTRSDADAAPPWLEAARAHVEALRFLEDGRSMEQAAMLFALANPVTACVFPPLAGERDIVHFAEVSDMPPLAVEELERIESIWSDFPAPLKDV